MTQDQRAVTQPMNDAYVAWEPPCELDVSKPARALGLIRSAFMAGYKSGERATTKLDERETIATIAQWCEETFGPVTIPRTVERAKEEFDELEGVTGDPDKAAIEAADVFIVLCRIPGFADAIQTKMGINRARQWNLRGDGTGYHVKAGRSS